MNHDQLFVVWNWGSIRIVHSRISSNLTLVRGLLGMLHQTEKGVLLNWCMLKWIEVTGTWICTMDVSVNHGMCSRIMSLPPGVIGSRRPPNWAIHRQHRWQGLYDGFIVPVCVLTPNYSNLPTNQTNTPANSPTKQANKPNKHKTVSACSSNCHWTRSHQRYECRPEPGCKFAATASFFECASNEGLSDDRSMNCCCEALLTIASSVENMVRFKFRLRFH